MDFHAKKVFMVDGIGAVLSAISLGVLLPMFYTYIGIPISVLHCFALMAAVFAVYSWGCYLKVSTHYKLFLRIIAVLNTLYIVATLSMLYVFYEKLSIIGLMYFIIELLIIITIIYLELRTSNRQRTNK